MSARFSSIPMTPTQAAPAVGKLCCPPCTPFKPHQRLEMLKFQRDGCNNCNAVPDPERDAQFGTQVVMSKDGNVLAVSAPLYNVVATDGQTIVNNGAVFIFERNTFRGCAQQGEPKWVFRQRLTQPMNQLQSGASAQSGMPPPSTMFNFGQSIALSQDGFYIVVGAPLQVDSSVSPVVDRAGGVFVYARCPKTCATWVFVTKLVAQRFDAAPAQADVDNEADCDNGDSSGSDEQKTTAPCSILVNDSETDAMFGWDVDISRDGGTIIVGAPFKNGSSSTFSESGAAYIYTRECTIGATNVTATFQRRCGTQPLYQFRQKLCGPEFPSCAGTMFGFNVKLSRFGDLAAVSKPSLDVSMSLSCPNVGVVCIFESNHHCFNYKLVQEVQPDAANQMANAMFGTGVRLTPCKRFLFVEAPGEQKLVGFKSGSMMQNVGTVYVFERQTTSCGGCAQYVQIARICPDFTNTNIIEVMNADQEITSFDVSDDGCVVAIGYETLLDGTQFEGEFEGGVVVFRFECGEWKQTEILRPFNADLSVNPNREHAGFGGSVTMSGNAETLVVGESTHLDQPSTDQLAVTYAYSFTSKCGGTKQQQQGTNGGSSNSSSGGGRMTMNNRFVPRSYGNGAQVRSAGSKSCSSCRK